MVPNSSSGSSLLKQVYVYSNLVVCKNREWLTASCTLHEMPRHERWNRNAGGRDPSACEEIRKEF